MKARAEDWRGYLRSIAAQRPDISPTAEIIIASLDRGSQVDIASLCFAARADWTRSIKIIRAATGLSIIEAQTLLLEHDGWLRLVKQQCRASPACAKQLRYAARNNTLPDWIELRDGIAVFRR